MSLQITKNYIPIGHPNRPGKLLKGIKARIWHGTANFNSSATDIMNVKYAGRKYTKKWNEKEHKWYFFEEDGKTPFSYGIAHGYIDYDSAIITIPTDEITYNCADRQLPYGTIKGIEGYKGQSKLSYDLFNNQPNSYTWSIELCMNDMNKWDLVCDNAIEFVKQYMPGLDKEDLRHYDVSRKNCPSPFVNLLIKEIDPRWIEFKKEVRKALGEV